MIITSASLGHDGPLGRRRVRFSLPSPRPENFALSSLEESGSNAYDQILQECRLALAEDEAEAIVLGCGGMADLADELAASLGVPVIEGVTAGVKLVEAVVALGLGTSKARDYAYPIAKPCLGLLDKFALPPQR